MQTDHLSLDKRNTNSKDKCRVFAGESSRNMS